MKRPQNGQTGIHQGVSRSVFSASYSFLTGLIVVLQQPGDFGIVLKSTGEFVVEGNIYEHKDLAHIAQKHPPCEGNELDRYYIHSCEVRGVDIGGGVGA